MITCTPSPYAGVMELAGFAPNGDGVVVRQVDGAPDFPLRGGTARITTGGISLVDTEAPFGVPLTYRTTVSGISDAERLVQQNLMLTPTFTHGVHSWLAGANRTLTVETDATAHSSTAVGHASPNGTVTTPTTPPVLIGHKDTAVGVSGSYTLNPATPSGGGAIATNDWMLIIHTQLSLASNPADPAGWTRIDDVTANNHRQIIWKRKRAGGDTSYTVAASVGAQSLGSLLWVRGSGDVLTLSATTLPADVNISRSLATGRHAVIRPSLVVSVFSASATIGQGAALTVNARISAEGGISSPTVGAARGAHATITAAGRGTGPLAGATMNYMVNSVTLSPRTLIVGTNSRTEATDSPSVSATYGSAVAMGFATQIAFQVADVLTNRVVASAKAAVIPATTTAEPHLLTGRIRFLHPGLWSWADVLAQGTWQNLKDTKPTWLDVRGTSSTVSGTFLNLFVTIVDPGTGADLIPPQRVALGLDIQVNTWLDISMLFANAVDIPATAEIRLVHGSTVKEFGIDWYLDEFGITPGAQRASHSTLYWFDGDSSLPSNPTEMALGAGWLPASEDAVIRWAGIGVPVRTNRAPNPRASSTGSSGWTSVRGFGAGAAGTYAFSTGQSGPAGTGITTARRKAWTTAATNNQDSGYQLNATSTTYHATTPGDTLAVSIWLRHSSATSKTARMRLQYYSQVIATGATPVGGTVDGVDIAIAPNTWTRSSIVTTVPAGGNSVIVYPDIMTGGGGLWAVGDTLDATGLQIEVAPAATAYFDGATPDGGYVYDWSATAEASSSVARAAVSELLMASAATTTSECRMDAPAGLPCEPILVSDPTSVSLAIWAQLIGIGNLSHPANETINRVLKRKMAVAISQVRSAEEGDLVLQTDTLAERSQMVQVTGSGRALLVRIPDPQYPEAGWYVSVGTINEERVFPDHRRPERLWTLPIVRVDRPTGLIEASGAVTWAEVLAMGDWAALLAARDNWLEVLVGGDVP